MAWVYDTYDRMHPGENNLPVVTGKFLELGGSEGRARPPDADASTASNASSPWAACRAGPSSPARGWPCRASARWRVAHAYSKRRVTSHRRERLRGAILAEDGDNLDLDAVEPPTATKRAQAGDRLDVKEIFHDLVAEILPSRLVIEHFGAARRSVGRFPLPIDASTTCVIRRPRSCWPRASRSRT